MEVGVEGELLDELELHCLMEERTLYPALRNCGDPSLEGRVAENFNDHEELKQAVAAAHGFLKAGKLAEVRDHLETVRALFEPHAAEEERELFALAERALDPDRLSELTRQARRIREEFIKRPGVASRRPQIVQNPNGGEQMRKVI
jgi:hemerythrin-like domain-containing protein